jgi:L-threonylcarbamoyladenylate synthase
MTPVAPTPDAIEAAAAALAAGRLVAFPTETVYGLGADASNPAAVAAIFAAKGRPPDHPLIVHLPAAGSLSEWAGELPAGATALAAAFWPGALTLIVPRASHVLDAVTGAQPTVGLRVPSHPVARALLAAFAARGGRGVAAPSANRFGHVSATTARHVADDLGEAVALILDGGPSDVGIESTIVALVGGRAMLLRPGAIAQADIERVLGKPLELRSAEAPRASGTLASHYAPRTRSVLVAPERLRGEIERREERDERVAVLARTRRPAGFDGAWIEAPQDAAAYAHALYANLRTLDGAGADEILIELPPDAAAWHAVHDRLARATSGSDDDRD